MDARGGQNPRRAVRRIVGRKIGVDATKKRGSPCMENCPSGIVSARATEKGSAERERESDRERGPRERERERGEEGRAKLRTGPVRGRWSGGGSRTASGIAGVTSNEHDKQTDVHSLKA